MIIMTMIMVMMKMMKTRMMLMIMIIISVIIMIIIIIFILISADRLRWKRFSVSHGDFGVTRSCVDSLSNIEIRPRDQRESQRRRTKMAMHVLSLAHGKSFRFVGDYHDDHHHLEVQIDCAGNDSAFLM